MAEHDLPLEDDYPIETPDDQHEDDDLDGDEYEVIPDDTEADIDGEHPDGDYPADIYDDDLFDDEIDESDIAVHEDEEA